MDTILRVLIISALVMAIQGACAFIISESFLCGAAFAAAPEDTAQGTTSGNVEKDVLDELDQKWRATEWVIVLSIFGVLFIAGIYWWTYGKLHHKLPKY